MKAHVPLILHAFSTFKLGGPQARFVQLANALGGQFRHQIVAMDGCFEAGARLEPQVQWAPLHLNNKRGGALANRNAFRQVLLDVRPDLVLSYNWGAIEWVAANWPRCVPQVHVEDGFGPEEAQAQLPRRVWTRRLLLAARRTPTIVASRNLKDIAAGAWLLPASRICFIPNGVDVAGLAVSRDDDTDREIVIGTVAGLRPEKNIARLVKAFAALSTRHPVRLVIVGDGPERNRLETLASELGVAGSVEFTGYLTNPAARLAQFDLFALSSNTEQLPISMLEAMAAGLPIVATKVGDVMSIIPKIAHEILSDPDDLAFTNALQRAIDQRTHWPAWRAAGLDVVARRFDARDMLRHWQGIFAGNWKSVFRELQGTSANE